MKDKNEQLKEVARQEWRLQSSQDNEGGVDSVGFIAGFQAGASFQEKEMQNIIDSQNKTIQEMQSELKIANEGLDIAFALGMKTQKESQKQPNSEALNAFEGLLNSQLNNEDYTLAVEVIRKALGAIK